MNVMLQGPVCLFKDQTHEIKKKELLHFIIIMSLDSININDEEILDKQSICFVCKT